MFIVNSYWFVSGTTYLLDTYSAAAAYSLRQLKTGVTNVVRVRRSSDNAESDFTATEITDGTLTTWTGANDGFVVTWYDQSGNGNNVTQSTAGNQPQIVSSGVVDSNGVKFAGSSDNLIKVTAQAAFNSEPFTYSSVHRSTQTALYNPLFVTSGVASRLQAYAGTEAASSVLMLINNGTTVYRVNPLSTLSTSTNYLQFGVADSSKGMEVWVNSTSQGTNTYTGTFSNTTFQMGANTFIGQSLIGHIAELIIWNSDESANRTAIESDINTYYSIY